MPKAIIIPPLGSRWVDKTTRGKVWGRRLHRHSGTTCINIPRDVRLMLDWEEGDILILRVEGNEVRVHRPPPRELASTEGET